MTNRLARATVVAALLTGVAILPAFAEVVMVAECDVKEVVIRQPITLWVSLRNTGSERVGIVPVSRLGQNMHFMYYEVTQPDGSTTRRKRSWHLPTGIIDPYSPGVPLAPGEVVEVTLDPTTSETLAGEPRKAGFTFPDPGVYNLVVCYSPGYYRTLWRPDDGEPLRSAGVTLVVRAVTPEEDDILDAYWSRSALAIQGIRDVLRRYETHPLADYLRFDLARRLLSSDIGDTEAVEILEALRDRRFRAGEVEELLANAYASSGDRADALDVLFDGIVKRPRFLDNYNYMRHVIWVWYGDHARVMEWDAASYEGNRRRFADITLPDRVLEATRGGNDSLK